ncbi:MAG: B12-binding domain-containing radical SAM protein [Actinobacteria bacterium]|nr:B12-binding domain-containing radical SAM protein [Actinomycetota bacterium]
MKIFLLFTEINQKFGPLYYQHGLASLSAVLKKNGVQSISLIHFAKEPDLIKWEAYLKKQKPDIIGIYSTAEQFHFVKELVSKVPQGIFTVCGGPHPTCYPMCIEDIPRLDAICIGEGEYPILELVNALKEGRDYSNIKNLWVRKDGNIVRNETRPFIANLDELPFEDRELFDLQRSIDKYGLGQVRVMTTRGCPYQCTYCANKRISKTQPGCYVRFRSAMHIMDELNYLNKRYKFNEIFFDDDIFMMDKAVRIEFCSRYPEEIDKPFVFGGRVEICNEEMLKELKMAGGRRIDFGVESGNEDLRRNILKRNMTNRQILEATKMAKAVGFQVKTLNIVGLPEETVEKYLDTVSLNQEIKPDVVSMSVFYPYPGTELYDYCIEKGYFNPDEPLPKGYISRRSSLLNLPDFSKNDIARCFQRFGFRVFRKFSIIKAIGYAVIYSKYGEFFMNITTRLRNIIVKLLPGF